MPDGDSAGVPASGVVRAPRPKARLCRRMPGPTDGNGWWRAYVAAMAKILFIVSGATYWVLKDGSRYATGYWAEEFANPYKIVTDAGHEVVVATPNGVTPNVDMMSLRPEMVGGVKEALELEAIIRSAEVMRRPIKLSDVRLEDYDAVYLPGGHGPMSDLAFDADVGRLLTAQLASGNPLFIVCHGPASIMSTRIHGVSPFKGYRITCFTNEEEEAVGLASRATWLLETDIKEKIGVNFSRGEIWKPYMVEDRNLVTGQNPASAAVLARRLLEVLEANHLVGSGNRAAARSTDGGAPAGPH
jgi:putative intracellular protease/amidase